MVLMINILIVRLPEVVMSSATLAPTTV